MEVGESSRKKVPRVSITPVKPILSKPSPICAAGEGIKLNQTNLLQARSCVSPHDYFANLKKQLKLESGHFTASNGVKNPVIPVSKSQRTLLTRHNVSFKQKSINGCPQQPQGRGKFSTHFKATSAYTTCKKIISQFAGMQINMQEKNVPIPSSQLDYNPTPEYRNDFDLNQPPPPEESRKEHQPKVITEGKPKQTSKPVTPKPAQSKDKPTCRRAYLIRKELNKTFTTPLTEVTGELTKPIMPESTMKSCRRSFHFETGEQPRDENRAPREKMILHLFNRVDVVVEKTHVVRCTSLSNINSPRTKPNANSMRNDKRKDLVNNQEGNEKKVSRLGQNNFKNSNNGNLTTGVLMFDDTKRKYSATNEHTNTSFMNQIGAHINELQAYHTMCWFQFPNVAKKRRSEKGPASNTSIASSFSPTKDIRFATCSQVDVGGYPYTSSSKRLINSCEYNAVAVPVTFETTDSAVHDKSQAQQDIFPWFQTRPTKRRSRVPTRFRDLTPLTTARNLDILPSHFKKKLSISDRKKFEDADRPLTGIDVVVAQTKVKRIRRENTNTLAGSAYSSKNQMQQNHKYQSSGAMDALTKKFKHQVTIHAGAAHQVTGENKHAMDALAKKFRDLDINRKVRDIASHEENALVPYNQQNQKGKTTVKGNGIIIPLEGPFDLIRKRRPWPKVDLEDEADRV